MVLWLALSAASADVLIVGNSYVFTNELDVRLDALLDDGNASRLADPGLRFVDHVDRAEGASEAWRTALVTSPSASWVVYQEQSQIPGFPADEADAIASRAAAVTLDGYARAMGAETVWLETWGRRSGDEMNPALYPDFATMNAALETGYLAYRDATSTEDRPTWIAPVGRAWKAIYDAEVDAGKDPLAAGSPFVNLYVADGSHPSLGGTYLAACVVYVTTTGHTCVGKAGPAELPAEEVTRLQTIASDVVFASDDLAFPWQQDNVDTDPDPIVDSDPPGDTGEDDVGGGCRCDSAHRGGVARVGGILQLGLLTGGLTVSLVALRRRRR